MRVSDRLWRLLRAELNSRLGNFEAFKERARARSNGSRGQSQHTNNGQQSYRESKAGSERYSQLLKHYQALELPYGATLVEVKMSYKRLAKKYHPDRFQDAAKREDATELLKLLNASYAAVLAHLEAQG